MYLFIGIVLVFLVMFYMALFKAASKEDEYLAQYYNEIIDNEK